MLIFVENITSRLTYTLDFIFKERDLNYELTLDKKYFLGSKSPKFNYSRETFDEGVVSMIPSSILFRKESIISVSTRIYFTTKSV